MSFRVHRSLQQAAGSFGPCALTIGNFDGSHVGHQQIFRRAVEVARSHGWKAGLVTFNPHPSRIVAPERAPRLLSTPEQRLEWFREAGIEEVLVLGFSEELARMTPQQFVEKIVVGALDARAVLVGDNFRFGARQAGDTSLLRELGRTYGFVVEAIPAVRYRKWQVSSSEVRKLVLAGSVSRACRLLSRPYAVEGHVVSGHGIGANQTVPTLNLSTDAEVLPARGVYITRTRDLDEKGRTWPSVTNIGYRPTFSTSSELSIETFLLSTLKGALPKRLRLEFLRRVREERKFPSPEALKQQILADAARAARYHRRFGRWVGGRTPGLRE